VISAFGTAILLHYKRDEGVSDQMMGRCLPLNSTTMGGLRLAWCSSRLSSGMSPDREAEQFHLAVRDCWLLGALQRLPVSKLLGAAVCCAERCCYQMFRCAWIPPLLSLWEILV
jgi:hypothetical protein